MLSLLKANSIKHKDEVMPTGMFCYTDKFAQMSHQQDTVTITAP